MKQTHILQKTILIFAIVLHLTFYVSAHWTGWFDVFFEHVTKGQDFFQIPNGASAFLQGGSLRGIPPSGIPRYTNCCGVNDNVYHPLLTILIGVPLTMVSPDGAFLVWSILHLIMTIIIVWHMYKTFRNHPLIYGAISLYLVNSYHYYEIQHAQFHFLFTAACYFLITEIYKKGDTYTGGILFFLSLFIKPIGLLFIIPFLLVKFWKTLGLGLLVYFGLTIPMMYWEPGKYFIQNIIASIHGSFPSYNLYALSRLFPIPITYIDYLRNICAIGLVLCQILYKPRLFVIIMLWIIFQLIFYSGVYHYYFAITSFLVFLSIVTNSVKRSKFFWITIGLLTVPQPILFFHLSGDPAILPNNHLAMIAVYSVCTVVALTLLLIRNMSQRLVQQ